ATSARPIPLAKRANCSLGSCPRTWTWHSAKRSKERWEKLGPRPRLATRFCCRRPARASTSSAISKTGGTSSANWWRDYDQEHLGPDQSEGRAARRRALRPLGHQRDGPLVLGDRQGPAAADYGADLDRPDRGRRCIARRCAALFGRERPLQRALL